MTIWTWPASLPPRVTTFRLRSFNLSSLAAQTQEYIPGGIMVQRFEASLELPPLIEAQWREMDGFLSSLRGAGGLLRVWHHQRKEPFYNKTAAVGSADWSGDTTWSGGDGWVTGKLPPFVVVAETASRGATDILVKGFPGPLVGVLMRGDLWEARPNGVPASHAHLYVMTGAANSNSDGYARIGFQPGLRRGLRAGDMVVLGGSGMAPSSVFRLASDDEGEININEAYHASASVKLIEVLPHG